MARIATTAMPRDQSMCQLIASMRAAREKKTGGAASILAEATPPVPDYLGALLAAGAPEGGSPADGQETPACRNGGTTTPVTSPFTASVLRFPTVPPALGV